jgi:uncharacterized protein (TIGR03435 family)
MRIARLTVLLMAVASAIVRTQAPPPSAAAGPTFDVVSIKKNTAGGLGSSGSSERPDGAFTLLNIPVGILIGRAYPPAVPADMVGLPGWAMSDRYDVSATSPLSRPATPGERATMFRAMLADRLKLAAHMENREQQVYDLVLARRDGRLGPGLTKVDVDCDAQYAAERAAAEAATSRGTPPDPRPRSDFKAPPPSCTLRTVPAVFRDRFGDQLGRLGDLLEGETTMANLARLLSPSTRRTVVDKTGLPGSYRVRMNFDNLAALRPPTTDASPSDVPSVFTAIQEQLGLKLESSREVRETLVIDHLERPTEN